MLIAASIAALENLYDQIFIIKKWNYVRLSLSSALRNNEMEQIN